jgi:hypothetical protein
MNIGKESEKEIKEKWSGVIKMRERMKTLVVVTFATGRITGRPVADVVYNLPVLLDFDVIKESLICARDASLFNCRGKSLGVLMDCAKDSLRWIDWQEMRNGVRRRNEIAHDGVLFGSIECLKDIDQVEAQLSDWNLI